MYIKQEYYLWKLAHELVGHDGFEILHVESEKSEVWLEKEHKGERHIYRLLHGVFNWRNEMKRDIDYVLQQIKQNSRLLGGRNVHVHCLYISEYPPVDEWENVNADPAGYIKKLHIHYLDDEEKQREHEAFSPVLSSPPVIPDQLDEMELERQAGYLKQQLYTIQQRKIKEAQQVFSFGTPKITYILLAINLMMFAWLEMSGGSTSVVTLIELGAKYNPAILEGEWWRIISSMFLHIGIFHLLMNMLALYYLGSAVERIYGSLRFLVIYFLAGIFGGLASFAFNPNVAAGASGAIFGLFGALLYFGLKNKRLFFQTMGYNLIFIITINVVFGFVVPQIDNGAHLGGLLGGFLASASVSLPKRKEGMKQVLGAVVYTAAVLILIFRGLSGVQGEYGLTELQFSQELIDQENYEEAISRTTNALLKPGEYEAELLFNRSFAYTQTDELDLAQSDLEKVIELQPDMAEAHYNLALIYQQNKKIELAQKHSREAARLNPDHEQFIELKEELNSIE
ncbi:rhomboid family intramembrane serine protease [Halobacillus sp. Marseille-Q1614]|uniref:rhomboid family intramembrane serine protease n=1 Tax=Halobacillus sp. Marseille-Q1614 TaxID=2709134 RepID=UPI00156F9FBE|nr:rhomboid family intramembrane serine protease [Halobacillus sp. Marseille-Q1614]